MVHIYSRWPYDTYGKITKDTFFVDKSMLLAELVPAFGRVKCYASVIAEKQRNIAAWRKSLGAGGVA